MNVEIFVFARTVVASVVIGRLHSLLPLSLRWRSPTPRALRTSTQLANAREPVAVRRSGVYRDHNYVQGHRLGLGPRNSSGASQ